MVHEAAIVDFIDQKTRLVRARIWVAIQELPVPALSYDGRSDLEPVDALGNRETNTSSCHTLLSTMYVIALDFRPTKQLSHEHEVTFETLDRGGIGTDILYIECVAPEPRRRVAVQGCDDRRA